ncbi:riboflavin synthase [Halobacteriovorax marinus]|uniref:Riboflavin synthase n=1 Tax=Halobacteriovorax marinus (strain ATCC BAA-682 / DSM 15412 / SJ) TaxID=862908 RepID=E1X1N7_HALMS|nr:riboflavin synthase [Halobacteriovorax marinus]ATH06393.1 riboflavin synthase [Halobacteriovorax marinus]CBW24956.1 riboflavin synthase alpha chain [Halobacteriovorax marinus SJ]
MFTGLVKEIGIVKSINNNTEGIELSVYSKSLIGEIEIDDSVSINGACQTAIRVSEDHFVVQTVHTSLEKTTLGKLRVGEEVNLELALRASDRLGGHIVQGHVNAMAEIVDIQNKGKNYQLRSRVSRDQMKYIVKEGSVTIDGISLTVADVDRESNTFTVSIIPHTWMNTILRNRRIGSILNIEVDILGKYVENLLFYQGNHTTTKSQMSEEWLRSKGF